MIEILDTIDKTLALSENKLYQGYYLWLEEFVRILCPKVVVELGTYQGGSTLHLLAALPKESILVTVDKDSNGVLLNGIVDPRLTVILGDDLSPNVWEQIPSNIDFLFIDSEHTSEQVEKELALYSQKFAPVCHIALDDIHLEEMEKFWGNVKQPKYDISQYHGSGFGLIIGGSDDSTNKGS